MSEEGGGGGLEAGVGKAPRIDIGGLVNSAKAPDNDGGLNVGLNAPHTGIGGLAGGRKALDNDDSSFIGTLGIRGVGDSQ